MRVAAAAGTRPALPGLIFEARFASALFVLPSVLAIAARSPDIVGTAVGPLPRARRIATDSRYSRALAILVNNVVGALPTLGTDQVLRKQARLYIGPLA
jgi:hypothetical protein